MRNGLTEKQDSIAKELDTMLELLAPQTKLPPERQLAEKFLVSRARVRDALGRLEAEGLAPRRPRHLCGTKTCSPAFVAGFFSFPHEPRRSSGSPHPLGTSDCRCGGNAGDRSANSRVETVGAKMLGRTKPRNVGNVGQPVSQVTL